MVSAERGLEVARLWRTKYDMSPLDLLMVDVGAAMERLMIRAAMNVGKPGYTPGYHMMVEGRTVVVYLAEDRARNDFVAGQHDFAERALPLLLERFGSKRVRSMRYRGVYHAFAIALGR
jgi:hypothetical protein